MMRDWGSRDPAFTALIGRVLDRLATLAGPGLVAVPMQGSGTFAVEAMIGTLVPRTGTLLVLVNGAYGKRIVALAERMGRSVRTLEWPEHRPVDPDRVDEVLSQSSDITHVAVVHCETTTGLRNPVEAVADVVATHGRRLLIDAMSAFGALPLSSERMAFDAVAASANKCLEGVPGLGFVIVRTDAIANAAGNAHSISLDLHEQWARIDRDGQFRFTPPTHVLAALDAALVAHAAEGGPPGRYARYSANLAVLTEGLRELGFETLLPDHLQAPIIVTVHQPDDSAWSFTDVYDALQAHGFAIYPGKLTQVPTFRVGCIGQVHPSDMRKFVSAMATVMHERGVSSGRPAEGVK
jgi:2-aminoethylphosphonate-pyruvate transaminase